MKTKIIILLVLFYNLITGQEIKNTNYISGTINVPILIDQFLSEDHLVDDRRDSNTKYENVSGDIYTQLKNIPIYFNNSGSFSGIFKEEIYDLITEISISGSIDTEKNIGSIIVRQKETKNVKAHPMNVCDYNYEYSYTYEYKNLQVSKGFEFGKNRKDNMAPYLFKPNENTTLTVSNYKYFEDTKCPKRNFLKEFLFKNIRQDYLNEKLTQKYGSYFYFQVYWDGEIITDNESIIYIISEVEDSQFKSMFCDCPSYNNQDQFLISYEDITDILLNRFNPDHFLPEYSSGENVLKKFNELKENLEKKYGISIISESSIKNNDLNKNKIISKIEVPLNDEGKDFCNLLRRIMESVNK